MTYRLSWTLVKYYRTYERVNVPEIWINLMTLIKLFLLLPIYWLHDINLLFLVFTLNSICMVWLNYILSQRMTVALDLGPRHVKSIKYFTILWVIVFLGMIFVMPLFDGSNDGTGKTYIFLLNCDYRFVYRKLNSSLSPVLAKLNIYCMCRSNEIPVPLRDGLHCGRCQYHHNWMQSKNAERKG